jgi:uncharacterized protein (DUF4415 family)
MKRVTNRQARELQALKRMPDNAIDLADLPDVADWSKAVVGKFYRPIKKPLTLRLDADVLSWLKSQGKGYQTRINGILRDAMEAQAAPRQRAR